MGTVQNIITPLHKRAQRDYLARMQDRKVHCSEVARRYGQDYWDGDRAYGYGGYKYDGRWEVVARSFIDAYDLKDDSKILDIGCGKGFLLYELKRLLPQAHIVGLDISRYAVENAKEEIRDCLKVYDAANILPFSDKEFEFVYSITTLHNLQIFDLKTAVSEIERVGKQKYIMVEAYRNVEELFNLQCWALTCESFFRPEEWCWLFKEHSYNGDYEFIYFE